MLSILFNIMLNIEKAIKNPTEVFADPLEIVESDEITREEKIKILKSWRYDAKQMSVATEENMLGKNSEMFSKILGTLKLLGVSNADESSQPTK